MLLSSRHLVLLTRESPASQLLAPSTGPGALHPGRGPVQLRCRPRLGERSLAAVQGKTDGPVMVFWSFLTRFLSCLSWSKAWLSDSSLEGQAAPVSDSDSVWVGHAWTLRDGTEVRACVLSGPFLFSGTQGGWAAGFSQLV